MSFLRLQQRPGPFLLTSYGFVRRSPIYDQALEIQAQVLELGSGIAQPNAIWVPLAECGSFPIGSTFGQNRTRARSYKKLFNKSFQAMTAPLLFRAEREAEVHFLETGRRALVPLPVDMQAWADKFDPRLALYAPELFRFYVGATSLLVDTLAGVPLWEPAELDLFIDQGRSGWDGDQTMVLAPHQAFWTSAAILQIALLKSQPDIWQFLQAALRRLRFAESLETDAIAGMQMIDQDLRLSFLYEDVAAKMEDETTASLRFCSAIVADHRPPGLKEIVVRLPDQDLENPPLGTEQSLMEPVEVERITSETTILRYPRPVLQPFKISAGAGRFAKRFPEWGRVRVRFDREVTRTGSRAHARRTPTIIIPAIAGSVAPGSASGSLARALLVPSEEPALPSDPVTRVPANFMEPQVDELLAPVAVSRADLPPLMRNFVSAVSLLMDGRRSALTSEAIGDEIVMLALPPLWRGLARPGPLGEPRLVCAIPVPFDGNVVWAIDILRRQIGEQFALGLVLPTVHDNPPAFLSRLLQAVCRRTNQRRDGAPRGTWPRAHFLDVRLENLSHTASRWHAMNLADAIQHRATRLIAGGQDI